MNLVLTNLQICFLYSSVVMRPDLKLLRMSVKTRGSEIDLLLAGLAIICDSKVEPHLVVMWRNKSCLKQHK